MPRPPKPKDSTPQWWFTPSEQKQKFALWLLPSKEDCIELQTIIDKLAIEHNAPRFLPHVTLFSGSCVKKDALHEIVPVIASSARPFQLKVSRLYQSEQIMQTVVIGLGMHESLASLCTSMTGRLCELQHRDLDPHLSLVYKEIPFDLRNAIIDELDYSNPTISFDKVCVTAPCGNDWYDFGSWQSFLQCSLGS